MWLQDKAWKFDEETGKWKSLNKKNTASKEAKSKQEAIQRKIQEIRDGKVPVAAVDDQDVERQAATGDASRSKEDIQQRIQAIRDGKASADTERQSLTVAIAPLKDTRAPLKDTDIEDQPSTVLVWSTKMANIDEVTTHVSFFLIHASCVLHLSSCAHGCLLFAGHPLGVPAAICAVRRDQVRPVAGLQT